MSIEGDRKTIGRFAPSPTGELHAGNIFAYLMSWLYAKRNDGKIVLRIEDLDPDRSKQTYADKIMRDLEALGLTWDIGPIYQHDRNEAYQKAYDVISNKAHVYPCFCTRADLHSASAPHVGEKPIYNGKCKSITHDRLNEMIHSGKKPSWRVEVPDATFGFLDEIQGYYSQNLTSECGDFVIRKADGCFAYQLAVVVDDAASGINNIVRGVDLLSSTPQQIFIQKLLDFDTPTYSHVPLFIDETGRRLSKRNKDAGLDALISTYKSHNAIIGHIAYLSGLIEDNYEISPQELLEKIGDKDISELLKDKQTIMWK